MVGKRLKRRVVSGWEEAKEKSGLMLGKEKEKLFTIWEDTKEESGNYI